MTESIRRAPLTQVLSVIAITIVGIAGCRDSGQMAITENRAEAAGEISTPGTDSRSTGSDPSQRHQGYQRTRQGGSTGSVDQGEPSIGTDTATPGERKDADRKDASKDDADEVRLSWQAPTHRENGEGLYLSEIREYVISYGRSPDRLRFSVTVESDGTTTMNHTLEDLDQGTWYFTVQTVDLADNISQKANVVSKSL